FRFDILASDHATQQTHVAPVSRFLFAVVASVNASFSATTCATRTGAHSSNVGLFKKPNPVVR
ncbi:MAG: hypothetical protein QXT77_08050, partial [Candidatus Methanomethylicaceae archaeon]